MEAAQALTRRRGWPLRVFLTPDRLPFYAGTYYPPEGRHGIPPSAGVLAAVREAWGERRPDVIKPSRRTGPGRIARRVPPADEGPGLG